MEKSAFPLSKCPDVESLAHILGTNYKDLSRIIYRRHGRYRDFAIPKKNGGERVISSPTKELKAIQIKLKDMLEVYYQPRSIAHGFISDKSIVSNATPHSGKKYVLNIDLKDFFPSINFGRLRTLLLSKPFIFKPQVASVVAQICCNNNQLPAGAPTSPLISNMIAFRLDGQLKELAAVNRCSVTRYADDISFSFTCNKERLPIDIVYFEDDEVKLGSILLNIIKSNGFSINFDKLRIQSRSQKQVVTGLVVNRFPNVDKNFISKTRAMIHALNKFGAVKAQTEHLKKYRKKYIPNKGIAIVKKADGDYFVKVVKGRLNYIKMVKGSASSVFRHLAYNFTCALGIPNEDYKLSLFELAARSVFVLENAERPAQGTCFHLKGCGLITNHHVIPNVNSQVGVKDYNCEITDTSGGTRYPCVSFVKSSEQLDIAIIDPDLHASTMPSPLEPNLDYSYSVGAPVIAFGFPNHSRGDSITRLDLIITGKRQFNNQIRIKVDKNFRHGFSGGVVLDKDAKVIGLVSNGNAIFSESNLESSFIPITEVVKYSEAD